jgi:hypothetical protein
MAPVGARRLECASLLALSADLWLRTREQAPRTPDASRFRPRAPRSRSAWSASGLPCSLYASRAGDRHSSGQRRRSSRNRPIPPRVAARRAARASALGCVLSARWADGTGRRMSVRNPSIPVFARMASRGRAGRMPAPLHSRLKTDIRSSPDLSGALSYAARQSPV